MQQDRFHVDGELYLAVETVAELYQVQVTWLESVYEFGLLGTCLQMESRLCIAAVKLDRVAAIVRLHQLVGPDLETIGLALLDEPD